jgi:hypothetical protein
MRILRSTLAAAFACAAATLVPAAAQADSIVFVKDHNVWLAQPDGSELTQVTTDGTSDYPYRSPSQADDGTIAASNFHDIVLVRQNGEEIRRLDPPPLVDSTSHSVDGVPVYVRISPDGSKVAYSYANYSCPIGADCAARSTTGVTDSDKVVPPSKYGQVYLGDPQWVTASRLMAHGGYLYHVNLWDLGQSDAVHWFDDQDWAGQGNSTDLGDGDLSRDGRLWVGIRGYDSPPDNRYRRLIWFKTLGDPATETPPPVPEAICVSDEVPGINGPSVAPSGDAFAFAEPEGILVMRGVATDPARCGEANDALVLPGGSEPDWGPADVDPQPRTDDDPPAPTLSIPAVSLPKALARGLKVRVAGVPSGKLTVTAKRAGRVVARGTKTVPASGAATVVLRFDRSARRKLRKLRSARLSVSGAGVTRKVTLRR